MESLGLYLRELNLNLLSEAEVVPMSLSSVQGLQASYMQNTGLGRQAYLDELHSFLGQ